MSKWLMIWFYILLLRVADAQDYRWQQRVEYSMEVKLDVQSHKLKGSQKLVYHNNSNDTLRKVYYHLYFNAFQPGSMMDVRSRALPDPDKRVLDRIAKLDKSEIGYQQIESLKQDGNEVSFVIRETIMEVTLAMPILPRSQSTFEMQFNAQVPLQVRRSGRDNKEGIAYSMTQWYPKMAEYDFRGWHAYPYVAREFHGVWGDFDVNITLDASYLVAGTGVLQNAEEIGYGYEIGDTKVKHKKGELTWHFTARNVHDFAWAADPGYVHERVNVPDGPELHFFYQKGKKTTDNWKKLQDYAVQHFQYMNATYGKYPYETYSIIQGGDGGMEYPMCTLITGERSFGSLVGVMAHEVAHSWFQGVLASNEALHHWIDEGFADFAADESMAHMFTLKDPPHKKSYTAYYSLVKNGLQEPVSQYADFYTHNRAYSTAAYAMGAIFLEQLKYIIGDENFYKGMRRYYEAWKFKHPEPFDFIRVMEKTSGIQLKWYHNYWIHTTKHIDYRIDSIAFQRENTIVTLSRKGELPMPVELTVTLNDGTKQLYYIPLNEMLGSKPSSGHSVDRTDLSPWAWVAPHYQVRLNQPKESIMKIEIDAHQQTADINRDNNVLFLGEKPSGEEVER